MRSGGVKADAVRSRAVDITFKEISRLGAAQEYTAAEGREVSQELFKVDKRAAAKLLGSRPTRGMEGFFARRAPVHGATKEKPITGNTERAIALAKSAASGNVEALAAALIESMS